MKGRIEKEKIIEAKQKSNVVKYWGLIKTKVKK